MKYKFMFDTNIFDAILDGGIQIEDLPKGHEYYVTHIQYDEILAIPYEKIDRQEKLLKLFKKLENNIIPTNSFVLGPSRLDQACLTEDNYLLEKISLNNPEHRKDALIAETAIINNMILVTNESEVSLPKRAKHSGCKVVCFSWFLNGKFK